MNFGRQSHAIAPFGMPSAPQRPGSGSPPSSPASGRKAYWPLVLVLVAPAWAGSTGIHTPGPAVTKLPPVISAAIGLQPGPATRPRREGGRRAGDRLATATNIR